MPPRRKILNHLNHYCFLHSQSPFTHPQALFFCPSTYFLNLFVLLVSMSSSRFIHSLTREVLALNVTQIWMVEVPNNSIFILSSSTNSQTILPTCPRQNCLSAYACFQLLPPPHYLLWLPPLCSHLCVHMQTNKQLCVVDLEYYSITSVAPATE